MSNTDFGTWLARTTIADEVVRAFIKAARADPDFPQVVPSIKALRAYLAAKHADRDTRLAAEDAWLDYRQWCRRRRRAERRKQTLSTRFPSIRT